MIVSACFPPYGWGGAEIAAEGIATWLADRGHTVAIYTDVAPEKLQPTNGESIYEWHAPEKGRWSHRANEHGKQNPLRKALWHARDHSSGQGRAEFARVAAGFAPDVVMVHLAPGLGVGIFEHCAEADIPVIFVVHDFWMTCLRSSMFSREGKVCQQREWMCRWSSTKRMAALDRIPRLGFWAPSRRIVELIRGELGDVFRNLLVERNVVNLQDFERRSSSDDDHSLRLLYVGKITAAKGVSFVLDCLARLPAEADFVFDLVGSGDLDAELQQDFGEDPRFRFHGVKPRAEITRFYHHASALLVPSLWFENSPLVIYQAQAAGLPVLGSDSGGIPELLHGRTDSCILPAGDHAAWTAKLLELATNRSLVAVLQQAARQRALDNNQVLDERGRKVEALCQTLIDQRS